MKSIDVAVKGIKETARDRRRLMFLVAFPMVFIALWNYAYGSSSSLSGGGFPHEVAVINNDVGVNNTIHYVNYGTDFTQVLENATTENSTTHLFHLNNLSEERANDLLKSRSIDALIIIPENFSSAFTTLVNNSTRIAITSSIGQQTIANSSTFASMVTLPEAGNATSTLFIRGDATDVNYDVTNALVTEIFDRYQSDVQANATARVAPGTSNSLFAGYIPVEPLPIAGTQSFSSFDFMVPGLIVFAILLQVTLVANSLARDVETGLLDRLKLTEARAVDLLSGTFMAWTLVIAGQVVLLVVVVTVAFGFHYQGGLGSLGLAVLIGVLSGMAAVSLGLIIASFSKNHQQAASLGGLMAAPLGLLSGGWTPLPRQVLGELAGRSFQVYDLLPWTHAVTALRSVLVYGTGLNSDVVYELSWLIILTAVLFVVGVATYSRARLRAEK